VRERLSTKDVEREAGGCLCMLDSKVEDYVTLPVCAFRYCLRCHSPLLRQLYMYIRSKKNCSSPRMAGNELRLQRQPPKLLSVRVVGRNFETNCQAICLAVVFTGNTQVHESPTEIWTNISALQNKRESRSVMLRSSNPGLASQIETTSTRRLPVTICTTVA
jgi:hypothetical protein